MAELIVALDVRSGNRVQLRRLLIQITPDQPAGASQAAAWTGTPGKSRNPTIRTPNRRDIRDLSLELVVVPRRV